VGLVATISFFIAACSKPSAEPTPPAAVKEITSFTLTKADGSVFDPTEFSVVINTDSVQITLPPLVDRKNLKASFSFAGKSVSPANGTIQDFSNPVIYTVTGENGSTKQYVVNADYAHAKSVVFIGASNNKFYALDAATGALRWSYTGGGSFAYSSATYKKGVVYIGCVDSYVYALNAMNGRLLWKYKAGNTGVESDAVIDDSTVYVGCNDDRMLAIDAVSGNLRWSYLTGGNISSSPKVADGNIYFGSSDGKLYALQAKTGSLIWQYQTGGMLNQSGASLVNGNLYVGSRDGYMYAIDAATGNYKWRFGTGIISFEQSSPTVNNGIIYIGGWYNVPGFTQKGSVYAVNASNGSLVWEKLTNTGFSSSPFVKNNRLYISGDDNNVSALNASTGSLLWQKQILPNSASPVEANGIVYVGGGGTGYIYAFDAATGNEIWKFPITGALMTSSPVVIQLSEEINYPGDSGNLD
jgi:outer membrane protein assembly factor BamB